MKNAIVKKKWKEKLINFNDSEMSLEKLVRHDRLNFLIDRRLPFLNFPHVSIQHCTDLLITIKRSKGPIRLINFEKLVKTQHTFTKKKNITCMIGTL